MKYGVLNSSVEIDCPEHRAKEHYIPIFEGKPRPTLQHICDSDGLWVLPAETIESVQAKRAARYVEETDGLLKEIDKDERLGEDVSDKLAEYRRRVNQIKLDLPFPPPYSN